MGHGDQFFLIIGYMGPKTGVVSFKPARGDLESRWRDAMTDQELYSLHQVCTSTEDLSVAGQNRYPEDWVKPTQNYRKVDNKNAPVVIVVLKPI